MKKTGLAAKNWSPGPKTSDGRTMVASGCRDLNALSAASFVLALRPAKGTALSYDLTLAVRSKLTKASPHHLCPKR